MPRHDDTESDEVIRQFLRDAGIEVLNTESCHEALTRALKPLWLYDCGTGKVTRV